MNEPVLVTPPGLHAVELDQVLAQANITDSSQLVLINGMIGAAIEKAERFTGLALIDQVWEQKFDGFDGERLLLRKRPVRSASNVAVTYLDADDASQILDPADYQVIGVGGDRVSCEVVLAAGKAWPAVSSRREAVTITYSAGYGSTSASVPEQIRAAVAQMVTTFHDYRDDLIIGGSVNEIPMDSAALLQHWRPVAVA